MLQQAFLQVPMCSALQDYCICVPGRAGFDVCFLPHSPLNMQEWIYSIICGRDQEEVTSEKNYSS